MKSTALAWAMATVILATGAALAGDAPAPWGPDGPVKEGDAGREGGPEGASQGDAPALSEDMGKAAAIEAKLKAGEIDAALAEATSLYKTTSDPIAKSEALRILAEGVRKKGKWKMALAAYTKVRNQFAKDTPEYTRWDACVEILRASPEGMYAPLARKLGAEAQGKTLADDRLMDEALVVLAEQKTAKLALRVRSIPRAGNPKALIDALEPIIECYREARAIAPAFPPEASREVANASAKRMQGLADKVMMPLRGRLEEFRPKMERPWSFTNKEKQEIGNTNLMLRELAGLEAQFQDALQRLTSTDWAELEALKRESNDRADAYNGLAEQYVVPAYTTDVW